MQGGEFMSQMKTDSGIISGRKDNYNAYSSPIEKALAIGLYSPSAHNRQSWKFKILNDNEALIYINEKILLPFTDPPARQTHISAGCFLEALSIGCTGIGYTAEIRLFPDGKYFFDDIGKKPVARVKVNQTPNVEKNVLWDSIFQRRVNRGIYTGAIITRQQFEEALSNVSIRNSKILFVNNPEEMKTYHDIFEKSMEIEFRTLKTSEETRSVFRFSDKEEAEKRDGLTFGAFGITGIAKFFAKTSMHNTEESWNSPKNVARKISNFNKGLDSAKGYFLLITANNTYEDHILAGRDTYQIWLALTKQEIYIHPLNQANEEYPEMDQERLALDKLVGIKLPEKIQMVARVGHAKIRPFESYRRHLKDYVI